MARYERGGGERYAIYDMMRKEIRFIYSGYCGSGAKLRCSNANRDIITPELAKEILGHIATNIEPCKKRTDEEIRGRQTWQHKH